MCFGLNRDLTVKRGQLAHLDHDRTNPNEENVAFLCQDCHAQYDTTSNRVVGFKASEVRRYRDELHAYLGADQFEWTLTIRATNAQYDEVAKVVAEAQASLRATGGYVSRREGPVTHE
jgi:formate-dependent nitrite reductase cytochrome c552 subunit